MANREVTISAQGMHCPSCAMLVEVNLSKVAGVESADVDYASEKAKVVFDDDVATTEALIAAVDAAGYQGSITE